MRDILWIVAVVAILVMGFFGMDKLGKYMDRNRKYRQDISRMRHKG